MNRLTWQMIATAALMALVGGASTVRAQQRVPDLILSNGKIITVDELLPGLVDVAAANCGGLR